MVGLTWINYQGVRICVCVGGLFFFQNQFGSYQRNLGKSFGKSFGKILLIFPSLHQRQIEKLVGVKI